MSQKRGRRSRDDQLGLAIHLFRQDLIRLEDDEHFIDCPGMHHMMCHLPRDTFKHGMALELLIQGAVSDVSGDLHLAAMPQAHRLAQFLDYWFCQRKTVLEIGILLHLNRSYVGRTVKPQALALVAQRFLALLQVDNPVEESQGVQDALHLHDQRRLGTGGRMGMATHSRFNDAYRQEHTTIPQSGPSSGSTEVAS